jgi:predicted DNA binding protein
VDGSRRADGSGGVAVSLIVVARIEHPDLALVPTIRTTTASIRVASHTATDPETGMFFFHVETTDFAAFEDALDADHTVGESLLVAEASDTRIYRLRHTSDTELISPVVIEMGGLMLETESTDRGWSVRMQFPDRETLGSLWEYCADADIDFTLENVYSLDEFSMDADGAGLTDAQRDALVTAYRLGYFEEPRDTSLQELADELDISPTAVGGRIRRGVARLVERTLVED